ncbi:hypothetical protein E0493_09375 [Roseomonas sp. M0104]|uniref:Rap1a immunity protein domain-containing protein n=1 Tax=Teichococcus coralli TaxID=2545983 RepID=A0A845BJD8_9PROT|nr:Rap1a/Tai family immunity protein [Pseudoroseomonas coralli]MXP63559.1 hypothetical protein [Pseudoroseomonas coralli]
MRRTALSLAFLIMGTAAATAQDSATSSDSLNAEAFRGGNGGDLARLCAVKPDTTARVLAMGYCHGFLAGVGQVHRVLTGTDGPFHPMFCPPQPPPTLFQVAEQYVAWMQAHPEHAEELAVNALLRFADATYPCQSPPAASRRRR